MRTSPDIIRNRRPLKQTLMLFVLFIAVGLLAPLRSPFAAPAATQSSTVLQTAGAPLLRSTADRIVYTIPGEGDFDVYAASFGMPVITENHIDEGDWK